MSAKRDRLPSDYELAMRRAADERRRRVVELRGLGYSFAEIGRLIGTSRQRAQQIHREAVSA